MLALAAAMAALVACNGGTSKATSPKPDDRVVVAAFNFPESTVLADIYASALEGAGIPVRRELDLGPRELVLPALQQHLVDVVPEYLGTSLEAVDPSAGADRSDPVAVRAALAAAFGRWDVGVLTPASAQNQNGLAVTTATAHRLHLTTTSDVVPLSPTLALGGPPECPGRPYCLEGLQQVYGLRFARFLPFDTEQQRTTALEQGVVDVAVVFTTDAVLGTGDVVLLTDDRHLQPAENVVPVVSRRAAERYGVRLTSALDAVSAKLTQNALVFLNWRVAVGGKDPVAEAQGWLERAGLAHPR